MVFDSQQQEFNICNAQFPENVKRNDFNIYSAFAPYLGR